MTPREAQTFSQEKILKGTAPTVLIFLLIFVLKQAPYSFYHGVLILFMTITSVHFYFILLILLVLSYLLGGRAGKEILINNKNYVSVSFRYVALIIFPLSIYLAMIDNTDGVRKIGSIFIYSIIYFIPLVTVWLLATYRMKIE